jgi:hypothetical protein
MTKRLFYFIVSLLIILFSIKPVYSQSKILINEFLIEPTPQAVEIINIGDQNTDLSGWIIDDDGGSSTAYTIPQNSIIYPNSCLVFSSNFYLNRSSADVVRLINNIGDIIDSFSYKSSSGSGISYFRLPDSESNWTTGPANLGLFNSTKTSCIIPPIPTFTLTPTPSLVFLSTITPEIATPTLVRPTAIPSPTLTEIAIPSISPTPLLVSCDNIYISEVMIYPETGEHEWVELYNDNDYLVSLQNWYIDDIENTGSVPKLFSLEIPAKSFGSLDLTSSVFNNDGDQVRLMDFNKTLKDSFEYIKAVKGKSFGRTSLENDEFCLQLPSNNSVNNSCIYLTNTPFPTFTNTPTPINKSIFITTSVLSSPLTNDNTGYEATQQIKPANDINVDDPLTERGSVLSSKTGDKIVYNKNNKMITYVRGFTSSSFFISILNISYIIHKILRRLCEKN